MNRREFTKALCTAPLAACVPGATETAKCMTCPPRNITIFVGGHEIRGFDVAETLQWRTMTGEDIVRNVSDMILSIRSPLEPADGT